MMDQETARLFVIAASAVAAVAWLAGLAALLRASRDVRADGEAAEEAEALAGRLDGEGVPFRARLAGGVEVEGDAEDLSARLASRLARESSGPLGPVKITARDRREVAFEAVGPGPLGFRRGLVRLSAAGPGTRLDYALETSAGAKILLGVGWTILGLGLLLVVGVPILMFAVVLPSPSAGVRQQAFQVIQMVHFLWPPFLFARLARLPSRTLRGHMDGLIANLPY